MSDPLAIPADASSPPSEAESSARSWSPARFLSILLLVLAFHIALVCLFGTKKRITARAVIGAPQLQLVTQPGEFIALGDPTLFARPNARDVVSDFWRAVKPPAPPNFNYQELPRYFPGQQANFGAIALALPPTASPLNLKPEPLLFQPELPADNGLPTATAMQISGDLKGRKLLHTVQLPSLSRNDILAPSTVQAMVDASGNVFSEVILNPTQDSAADQLALYLVRGLQFAPAPRATFGQITFAWHTVPVLNTNEYQ
jgi:hypothetical protein